MSIDTLKDSLGDYAKDIRLNLGSVLTEEGAPDLTLNQIYGIALASAYCTRNEAIVKAVKITATSILSEGELHAAKSAATIMAMNNIYYRFTHLVNDKEFSTMPAKLRMNVIGSPGIPKSDFEMYCLAVSAINGCGMCMDAHVHEIIKAGVTKLAVQSCIRIASVINAAAQGQSIAEIDGAQSAQVAA